MVELKRRPRSKSVRKTARRWFVYILRCRDGSLYTGITTDVVARLATHNTGHGAKYTRSRRPARLVWSSRALTESGARKREWAIKSTDKNLKELMVKTQN